MACAQGSQAALYVEPGASPHTFDSNSERYEFRFENLVKTPTTISSEGIRGTRQESKEQTREGHYTVGGPIVFPTVSPLMLDNWLPRIMGAAESTDVFAFAESLPSFGVLINRVTDTFEYKDCFVNSAMFEGASGPGNGLELLTLTLDIWGRSVTEGTSAPAVSIATTATSGDAYKHSEAVFTIAGTVREVKRWRLLISNHLQRRWVNSQTATAICPRAFSVVLDLVMPFETTQNDITALSTSGVAGSIAITNSTVSTTFTFGTLEPVIVDPNVVGKSEIDITARFIARKSGSTDALSITSDSTV
jgi:hypothetical protein